MNGSMVQSPLRFNKPCVKAADMFSTYADYLWKRVNYKQTMVLPSELLDTDPEQVWRRLTAALGLPNTHPKLRAFKDVRYNTQENKWAHGVNQVVNTETFKPGLYAISNFEPLRNDTRKLLDVCWREDCIWASIATGYVYKSCKGHIPDSSTYLQQQHGIFKTTHSRSMLHGYLDYAFTSRNDTVFRHIRERKCRANFNTIGDENRTKTDNSLLDSNPSSMRAEEMFATSAHTPAPAVEVKPVAPRVAEPTKTAFLAPAAALVSMRSARHTRRSLNLVMVLLYWRDWKAWWTPSDRS
jgi:hypothetical protein